MTEYRLELVNKHLTINTPSGRLLIDTGSPLSFHKDASIEICGNRYDTATNLLQADADYLTDNVGVELSGLVGMDILSRYAVLIDIPSNKIVFGYEGETEEIPSFSVIGGYAGIILDIDGESRSVLVDTGAPVAYISNRLTEGLTPSGETTDFSPMTMSLFTTPLFNMRVDAAGHSFDTQFGHLPNMLQMSISLLGIDGVIGYDLLSRVPVVLSKGKFSTPV